MVTGDQNGLDDSRGTMNQGCARFFSFSFAGGWALLVALLAACPSRAPLPRPWNVFRPMRQVSSAAEPLRRGLDYARFEFQRVLLRRIPGACDQGHALVTLRLQGVPAEGSDSEILFEPRECEAADGLIDSYRPSTIEWFPVGSPSVRFELSVRPLNKGQYEKMTGAFQGLKEVLGSVNLTDAVAAEMRQKLFAGPVKDLPPPTWSYGWKWTFGSGEAPEPKEALPAGRAILVFGVRGETPPVRPNRLQGAVLFSGTQEYREGPYVILRIERATRAPAARTAFQNAKWIVEDALRREEPRAVLLGLKKATDALALDPFLTARDRELEKELLTLRRGQADFLVALNEKKDEAAAGALAKEIITRIEAILRGRPDLPSDEAGTLRDEVRRLRLRFGG